MHRDAASSYLMHDPREAERLARKVDAQVWVQRWVADDVEGLVVDVGCGSGVIPAAIARRWPLAHVVGIDMHPERVLPEAARHFEVLGARADHLPLPSACADLVTCRFLLQYLPDPERAVVEMVRVLRPGGRLLLQDLDGQLVWHHPLPPDFAAELDVVVAYLRTTGFDPFVGRKLFALARQAGCVDIDVEIAPYHLYAGTIAAPARADWQRKLAIAARAATAAFGGDSARAHRFLDAFEQLLCDPDALTYSCQFTVRGVRAGLTGLTPRPAGAARR
ncbi:MAG: class I SAM-dependent methyltransferase [Planctomycetota bacterium]